MRFEIVFAPEAVQDLRGLKAGFRAEAEDGIEKFLRHEPTHLSKSRIKKLRGLQRPQYRLRIGDIRVFYDVKEGTAEILAVVAKSQAPSWLLKKGELL